MGQRQQKVIIWTNFDGPKAPLLHTKAQGNWPFGSGEDFWRVFTIYGHGGHLSHVTQMPQTNFRSPDPWRLHMKFGFDWPSGFGEDLWKWWTDGQQTTTDDKCLYYKLTNEPKSSGELKIHENWKLDFSIDCPQTFLFPRILLKQYVWETDIGQPWHSGIFMFVCVFSASTENINQRPMGHNGSPEWTAITKGYFTILAFQLQWQQIKMSN